ncbi:MAG: hypothetical protein IH613_01740 [Desulfuromonadales bacterium]|nr:hypothetical protein [Desulfuromonadales bacterium]
MAVKIGPSFNDCVTNFSGNVGNKCHNIWRKKCPPQEQAFLLTFLALKKVRRLAGRDPPVLFLILLLISERIVKAKPRGCAPARRLTFFACAKESKQRNAPRSLALLRRVPSAAQINVGRAKTRYAQTVRPADRR